MMFSGLLLEFLCEFNGTKKQYEVIGENNNTAGKYQASKAWPWGNKKNGYSDVMIGKACSGLIAELARNVFVLYDVLNITW